MLACTALRQSYNVCRKESFQLLTNQPTIGFIGDKNRVEIKAISTCNKFKASNVSNVSCLPLPVEMNSKSQFSY
jgi:hypothetical protein